MKKMAQDPSTRGDKRYLVLSDLHLCDFESHADGWKSYKEPRYAFDHELSALIEDFGAQAAEQKVLVLNGDILDFDLLTEVPEAPPWPISRRERRYGLDADGPKTAWKVKRILEDHPIFVDALIDFLAAGHRIVYVLGNHDAELRFAQAEESFRCHLEDRAQSLGHKYHREALQFEPWFYYVPGEIYVEHGQQYDEYTSFEHVLAPYDLRQDKALLALSMGNLSNRRLLTQMGFFNPHATDYILGLFSYMAHWLRHYAFSRRSLMGQWFLGSVVVLFSLLGRRRAPTDKQAKEQQLGLEREAARKNLSVATLKALDELKRPPITSKLFRMVREFWIDRVVMAVLMTAATVALALVPIPLWIKLMIPLCAFPLVYFFYEGLVQGESVFSAEASVDRHATDIAKLLPVQVISFGHTHHTPSLPAGAWLDLRQHRNLGASDPKGRAARGKVAQFPLHRCQPWQGPGVARECAALGRTCIASSQATESGGFCAVDQRKQSPAGDGLDDLGRSPKPV